MSIFSQLKKIAKGYSYHTPGHKGKLYSLDGTEIEDIFPGDCIERAQAAAARHFGAKNVRFLVNGSSIGVKSMIMSVGGDVLAPVNRHRSADEGAALAGVKLKFIENTLNDGLPMPITAEMIEKYKALTPYLRIRTETRLNFFAADSREMIGLLNQYAEGAIDLDRFIDRYAAMARMMQLESAMD